jgi:hypothetical protein
MPGKAGKDANDAITDGKLSEFIDGLIDIPEKFHGIEDGTEDSSELVVLSLEELLKRPTPPRQNILSPWLAEQGL